VANARANWRTGDRRRRGFTLLEILLVLMLLGLLGALMIGGAASLLKSAEAEDPEAAVLTLLQKIRGQAVETGQVIELKPLPEDEGFLWGADAVETLPKREGLKVRLLRPEITNAMLIGGVLEETPITRVRFYPDGSCDPLRVQVRRGDTRRVYAIDPWTAAPLPEGGRK
jgi:prepilin-type N-terminal cleavage/methylation domain-containing protein